MLALVLLCKRISHSNNTAIVCYPQASTYKYSLGQYCEMPLARISVNRSQKDLPLMIRPCTLSHFARELLHLIPAVS